LEIVIQTKNPHDITMEEAEQIASILRNTDCDFSVTTQALERTGYGVTWFEVLNISVLGGAAFGLAKAFAEEVVKKIADIAVDWAHERFKGPKSKSKRPVYVAIYGPDGLLKSLVITNAIDPPEDRTAQDLRFASAVSAEKTSAPNPPKSVDCGGKHFCPTCREVKPCAFGACAVVRDVKCDSCLYLEEFGPKAAAIIEKAIAVAAILHDSVGRVSQTILQNGSQPWPTKEEARVWMNEATDALEKLDSTIGRLQLRMKARFS